MRAATITHVLHTDALRIEMRIDYTPAELGRWTLPNGDPGYPGEPEVLELLDYKAWLCTDLLLPLPVTCDEVRVDSPSFQAWLESWLEDNAAEVIETAEDTLAAQREDADDARREMQP